MLRIDFEYWRDNGQLKATSAGLRSVLAFAYANGPAAGGVGVRLRRTRRFVRVMKLRRNPCVVHSNPDRLGGSHDGSMPLTPEARAPLEVGHRESDAHAMRS